MRTAAHNTRGGPFGTLAHNTGGGLSHNTGGGFSQHIGGGLSEAIARNTGGGLSETIARLVPTRVTPDGYQEVPHTPKNPRAV